MFPALVQAGRQRWAVVLDVLLAVALTAVIESLVWTGRGPGDPIPGPRWATAALPLLLAAPLVVRRSRPLTACVLVFTGAVLQAVLSGGSAEGLYWIVAAGMVSWSVAASSPRPRALAGLGVIAVGSAVWMSLDRNVRSGRAADLWAGAFFALYLLALWLTGAVLQSRREAREARVRTSAAEEEARRAVADERSRIARELHDIVSHKLSVVVVQAAGGRALPGRPPVEVASTLEKIEASGREALAEMRRLLGVLRTDDAGPGGDDLMPTPGIDQLEPLAQGVRDGGARVLLRVDPAATGLSPGLALSVYRIVQESLTNVLKHAGRGATAEVTVRCAGPDVVVSVVDDGPGPDPGAVPGHGLRGMRERAELLGGELVAGGRPEGGFAVTARLPLRGPG